MISWIRQTSVNILLAIWAAVMAFVCATLMIGHWIPLPAPQVGTRLQIGYISPANDSASWKAFHFLSCECTCSQRILKHLLDREPLQNMDEVIVCIGESDQNCELLFHCKYTVVWVKPEELKSKYNVESAPLLVVLDSDKIIQYSGAYTTRKQGFAIQDVSIISRTRDGESIPPFPLFGCGMSRDLQALTDPLGLKNQLKRKATHVVQSKNAS